MQFGLDEAFWQNLCRLRQWDNQFSMPNKCEGFEEAAVNTKSERRISGTKRNGGKVDRAMPKMCGAKESPLGKVHQVSPAQKKPALQ